MKSYYVQSGTKVRLKDYDPNDTNEFKGNKEEGREELGRLNVELERLQESLYVEGKHKILIILQGMDTSGKDGVIRAVFEGVNPQGVRVACFKVPTNEELAHDYLWRIHKMTPSNGEMVIFNRSHYEDVLVVRVHDLVPESVWKKRYSQINAFENLLAEEGTTILKFFLYIDSEEQKQRLLDRLAETAKHWKFNPSDLQERALWEQYMEAYEDVLSKTSTTWAPWYIIPSNKKWYRDLLIARTLVDTLNSLHIQLPHPLNEIDVERYRMQLLAN